MHSHIIKDLEATIQELLQALNLFSQEQVNIAPHEGAWSGAQIAEHVLKSELIIPKLWKGKTETPQRPFDEKADQLKTLFSDTDQKLKSPDFIIPSDDYQYKDQLYNSLLNNRKEIIELAKSVDLEKIYSDFPFPVFGMLSGYEWATFIIHHSRRHSIQLRNTFTLISKQQHIVE